MYIYQLYAKCFNSWKRESLIVLKIWSSCRHRKNKFCFAEHSSKKNIFLSSMSLDFRTTYEDQLLSGWNRRHWPMRFSF